MLQRTRFRRVLLILMTIALPAAVLVALARRVVLQERELAKTQSVNERRNAVEQLRRELAAQLETVKLQEVNRWIRAPNASEASAPDASLVFVAALDGDRLVLPWEAETAAGAPPSIEFAARRFAGESLEFTQNDFEGALAAYRQARGTASGIRERCDAQLLEARVLMKSMKVQDAAGVYRRMLDDCDQTADEDGIPYSFYAAERLVDAVKETGAAFRYLVSRIRQTRWFSPYQAYMIRSLLKSATGPDAEAARRTVESRIAEAAEILEFAKSFHRIRPLAETGWTAYGPEPWLVTVVAAEPPLPSLVFAVSSAVASQRFVPPSAVLASRTVAGGEPLGEGFAGLNVKWRADAFSVRPAGAASVYTAGIAFILIVSFLAGYLLLRDVHRDLRLAALRSNFVASVSHELKTPLTAIRMFAETLALGRARDERTRSEYLETIVNESERLARLVDNVLDFSKIEQGKKIYRLQPARLSDVVRSAARAMQYPLAQQGFTLDVRIDGDVDGAPADVDALEQAILNLLSNAMKYSGDSRRIELRLRSEGAESVIEVADAGIGIAAEEQPRVFEKFYRGSSEAARMIAGTGLGLTIVQHIALAHGGRVELRSSPGAGSTFAIRIPLAKTEGSA